MKIIKINKKDTDPKELPEDSRTQKQVANRISACTKKIKSLDNDMINYLRKQSNTQADYGELIKYFIKINNLLDEVDIRI